MNQTIDLRADTVTRPTREMMEAMADARLGDDVMGEDAATLELEAYGAELTGKEAGLLVTSGTMGNLTAILTHAGSGRPEIIAEASSHIILSEAGNYARLASVAARQVAGIQGILRARDIEDAIRDADNLHHPRTALICIENTHNRAGGTVYPLEVLEEIRALADRHGIPMHLDGARLFNAAAALGVEAERITRYFDSAQFCLSKGLSAPVGSLLVGSRAFIDEARHFRKMLGGGMRQSGIIAAPGLVALKTMRGRLSEDHANARALAEGIAALGAPTVDLDTVQSNIVRVDTQGLGITAQDFAGILAGRGLLSGAQSRYGLRFVTHRHITAPDIRRALSILREAVREAAG